VNGSECGDLQDEKVQRALRKVGFHDASCFYLYHR
jgi:hypothetical protein